jgi:uncharacterized protein YacL
VPPVSWPSIGATRNPAVEAGFFFGDVEHATAQPVPLRTGGVPPTRAGRAAARPDSPRSAYTLPVNHDSPHPRVTLTPIEMAERQRHSLLQLTRIAFLVIFGTVVILAMLSGMPGLGDGIGFHESSWPLAVIMCVGVAGLVILVDYFTPRKKIGMLVSIYLGLLAAILATLAVGYLIDLLAYLWGVTDAPGQSNALVNFAKVIIGIGLAYLCITTVLQTQDDFRLVIPYVEFAKQLRGPRPLLLDSSALIDARIADLSQTGIIQSPVIIPSFVIAELQHLADSQDKLVRARGRRGLDVITRIQRQAMLDISIDETPVPGKSVDPMLVELARQLQATIVTTDMGLSRVASIQGVRVLNLNDIANALKPAVIPGEQLSIRLLKGGEQPQQGVGYLEDGTMVVAENGRRHVGEQVTLTVTSTLQTSAGRLIFGRVMEQESRGVAADPEHQEAHAAPGTGDEPPIGEAALHPERADGPAGNGLPGAADEADGGDDAQTPIGPEPVKRSPFPPKPPARRTNPARNPRR